MHKCANFGAEFLTFITISSVEILHMLTMICNIIVKEPSSYLSVLEVELEKKVF